MKTVTKEYTVYEYDELTQTAKDKVIEDVIQFYVEAVPYEQMTTDMQRACDKAEAMRTPWFVGSYIWEYCKAQIEEAARDGTYLANGEAFTE